jgi:hypothetical protein
LDVPEESRLRLKHGGFHNYCSTVSLRVVGGDENGRPVPGGITGPPSHWDIYGDLALQVGGVWNLKYGHESRGTRTREWLRCRGPAANENDRPLHSTERAAHINKPTTVSAIKMCSLAAVEGLTPRLTVVRNINLAFFLVAEAGESSGIQRKKNVHRWKPLSSNG